MTLREWTRVLWNDYKAWRGGLVRIASRQACNGRPTRGRVYEEKPKDIQVAKAEPIVTVTAVHFRGGHVVQTQTMRGRVKKG